MGLLMRLLDLEPESLALTCLLAVAHLVLYALALLATRYPVMTVFHGFLAVEALAFGVRPLLAAAEGGYTLYPATASGWAGYNRGLMYQLLFNACVVAAYLWARRGGARVGRRGGPSGARDAYRDKGDRDKGDRDKDGVASLGPGGDSPAIAPNLVTGFVLSLLLGTAAVAAMHGLSGGAWLPGRRAVAITAVVPYGKLLFPLAVIPLSASLPLAYLVAAGKRRTGPRPIRLLLVVAGTALAGLLLVLLYQRGYLLNGLLVAVFLHDRLRGVSYARAAVAVLAILVLLGGLRPLASSVAAVLTGAGHAGDGARVEEAGGEGAGEGTGEARPMPEPVMDALMGPVRSVLLRGANFDHADVWPVALDYASQHGLLGGATMAAIPARFLTPSARQQTGFRTAVDRLNEHYWKQFYWQTRFGFNVTLPQELYLNFGTWPLAAAGVLPGLLTDLCDRWLWRRRRLDVVFVYAAAATFAAGGFVKEPGAVLQWTLAYLLLGVALEAASAWLGRGPVPGKGATA